MAVDRTVKPVELLDDRRVVEKLEIERRYWLGKGIDWGIVTERELPAAHYKNIEWVHPLYYLDGLAAPGGGCYEQVIASITPRISRCGELSLAEFSRETDRALGLEAGTCLMLMRHLLARKVLRCDFAEPLTARRLSDFSLAEAGIQDRGTTG